MVTALSTIRPMRGCGNEDITPLIGLQCVMAIMLWLVSGAGVFAADEPDGSLYTISISGPAVNLETSCDDPCAVDEVVTVGSVDTKASKSDQMESHGGEELSFGSECSGNCRQQSAQLRVETGRELREGVELSIEEQWAHFVFHSVTDTDKGPATKRQHFEFRIDRPLIEVDLGEHRLRLTAKVEQDPSVIRRKSDRD